MRILVLIVALLISSPVLSQEKEKKNFFKEIYKDFLKYGTVYGAGDIKNSIEAKESTFFVRPPEGGGLYDIPEVVDNTPIYPFDYRYGFGIRKLARFDYERKPKNFYDGTESQLAFVAPSSAIQGLEYQLHYEKERFRGEEFENHRYFLKHTGKWWIVKGESREVGKVNLKYQSAEVRGRIPIGKKLSISAGAIYRTHERPYGYNPVEIWLNETDENGNALNPWYTLGFEYWYTDHYTSYSMDGLPTVYDWIWMDPDGNVVAYGDRDFRDRVMPDLMNRYNNEIFDTLDPYGEVAPIIGFDFYHYKSKFWLHAYGSWILPYHKYLKGDSDFNYLNRDNWGNGGLIEGSEPEQWSDYNAGVNLGWKLSKSLGVFIEGEYIKFWDQEIFNSGVGLNLTLR